MFGNWRSRSPRRAERATYRGPGFPSAAHPAEPDLFVRQRAMPGHDQGALESRSVALIGCGGLGSWIGLGLVRMGIRRLSLIDGDVFDRTNAPRQLMHGQDLGQPKASALARHLVGYALNPCEVVAIPHDLTEQSLDEIASADLIVVGVDSNVARLTAARATRRRRISAVFAMLSSDGLRAQVFLQRPDGPCLSCVLPNLDPDRRLPCAAASIASCFLAAAHVLELVVCAASDERAQPTWREISLDGSTDRMTHANQRRDCHTCGGLLTST